MTMDARVLKAGGPGLVAFLSVAMSSWRTALGRNLSGVYVHGSVATGGFNPRTSDVDVIVATRSPTDAAANDRIDEVHQAMLGLGDDRWADRLDLMFLPANALSVPGIPRTPVLELHPDEGFAVEPLGPDFMIQRHVLRQRGIRLVGPRLAKLVSPVTPGELRDAQIAALRERWLPQLEYPGQLLKRGYQAYAVSTMCQALCLLVTGDAVSKPDAAAWALRGPYLERGDR